ncbi:forkhead box protein [Salix suchowensis]|nr:forkhead box protein [Salix suchowensis]
MTETLDDGEFWLPPQFLIDDDKVLMENNSNNNLRNGSARDVFGYSKTDYGKSLFPLEFPCGLGSFGFSSDLSSPVESVEGSTETESDEEDYLAGLTRQIAHTTLEEDFKTNDLPFGTEKSKSWKPKWIFTTSNLGSSSGGCRRSREDGMSNEEGRGFNNQSRGLLGPPRNPSPISNSSKNPNSYVSLYQQQPSLSYQKLQASQLQQLRVQQQMMQQQKSVWGVQNNSKGTGLLFSQQPQQNQSVAQNRGRNVTSVSRGPLGLSASAWPPLRNSTQQQQQSNSQGGIKRECAGTGVFLPRQLGARTESRKKPGCSTVLLPAKVVQALNLNLEGMGAQAQFGPQFNGGFVTYSDAAVRVHHDNLLSHQKQQRSSSRSQPAMNKEVRLPQEWTY